jgi:hypothetical protein
MKCYLSITNFKFQLFNSDRFPYQQFSDVSVEQQRQQRKHKEEYPALCVVDKQNRCAKPAVE